MYIHIHIIYVIQSYYNLDIIYLPLNHVSDFDILRGNRFGWQDVTSTGQEVTRCGFTAHQWSHHFPSSVEPHLEFTRPGKRLHNELENPPIFKFGKSTISMGHGFQFANCKRLPGRVPSILAKFGLSILLYNELDHHGLWTTCRHHQVLHYFTGFKAIDGW